MAKERKIVAANLTLRQVQELYALAQNPTVPEGRRWLARAMGISPRALDSMTPESIEQHLIAAVQAVGQILAPMAPPTNDNQPG